MIFLRPYWLLLLIIPFLFLWFQRKVAIQNPWRQYIAPQLLPYLSVSSKIGNKKSRLQWLLTAVWCLMTIALAGPAFDKWPTPVVDEAPTTVLIVDLNTLNPEKTTQLHLKLYDLIQQLHDNQIGLVLYDTKGYIALPVTRDSDILNALVPSLQSTVMPAIGNDVSKGFEKADELFKNIGQKNGRILLLTGGTPDIQTALPLIRKLPYTVGVLGIGNEKTGEPVTTRTGSFLQDGAGRFILSRPDKTTLSRLGTYYHATPTGNEIKKLIDETTPKKTLLPDSKIPDFASALIEADVWRDLGIYFACAILPLLAFLFRKGIFFVFILAITCLSSFQVWADIWLRPDQKSYRTIQAGNAAYQQKDYRQALDLYNTVSSNEALYNKANTLAYLGQYQSAIDAYTELLKQNPDYQDAAYNKEYLEKQLQQPQEQKDKQEENNQQNNQNQHSNQGSESQDNSAEQPNNQMQSDETENSDTADSNTDSQSDIPDESTQSESQQNNQNQPQKNAPIGDNEKQNDSGKQPEEQHEYTPAGEDVSSDDDDISNQDGTQPNIAAPDEQSDSAETARMPEGNEISSDKPDQETQQIINRLKKDPSRVLRYRLYRQHQGY